MSQSQSANPSAFLDPLVVDLGHRRYPITIGQGLLRSAGEAIRQLVPGRLFVVSNPTVAALHLAPLMDSIGKAGRRAEVILIPDGEAYKTASTLTQIHTRLLELGADRRSALLALGGGVVGDLAGYAAATYQRGIDFVQLPTTLLAQVDSSVGGKTGINHSLGKNMIGAFHQPRAVIIDTDCLQSLPPRELATGLAEVIKYGLIRDPDFFVWLENSLEQLVSLRADSLAHAIRRSCEIKAAIVASDETEAAERAILNFGHTFGHAIEAGLGYGVWTHGEAVAAGMVMATHLSEDLGQIPGVLRERLVTLLRRARLPVSPPALEVNGFLERMRLDKKTLGGRFRLILLHELGRAGINDSLSADDLRRFLDRVPELDAASPRAALPSP
ncbi:MAG: 3-dehydroquinate synthase [Burkholderiales bacterium]|nr:MAG: 3-dehydroquinate synthase [Burkholderiales bacterium]